jgi:uncharacterized membrane protein
MTSMQRVGGAALLGAVCGMRTFVGPAALALRGRMNGAPTRVALTAAAAGEAIGDKTPVVPARTAAPSVAARVLSGALSGRQLAGATGIAPGAVGAIAGTFGAYRAREGLARLTGLPAPVLGLAEDAAAVAAAALATCDDRDGAADGAGDTSSWAKRILYGAVRGAVAGATATAVMTAAQTALQSVTGASPSRAPERVTREVFRRLVGRDVPRRRRDMLNEAAHWLYGTWWGVDLGVVAVARGRRPSVIAGGAGLGLAALGAAQLQLPAAGVAAPAWRRPPRALVSDAGLHLLHGLIAAAVLRALP